MKTYSIYRYFQNPAHPKQLIREGYSKSEAQEWCSDRESSSKDCCFPESLAITEEFGEWFDGYEKE
jgi:hypothetical protein